MENCPFPCLISGAGCHLRIHKPMNYLITWSLGVWISGDYCGLLHSDATWYYLSWRNPRIRNHQPKPTVVGWKPWLIDYIYIYICYVNVYNHGHAYAIIHTYNPILTHSNPGSLLGMHGWYPQSLLRNTENDLVFNALENMYPGYCTHSE